MVGGQSLDWTAVTTLYLRNKAAGGEEQDELCRPGRTCAAADARVLTLSMSAQSVVEWTMGEAAQMKD